MSSTAFVLIFCPDNILFKAVFKVARICFITAKSLYIWSNNTIYKNAEGKNKGFGKIYSEEFIQIRHHLHKHPKLSYKEFETSKFVQGKLSQWGIAFEVMATTGVIGILKGKNPGKKVVALRADMDALPITEQNQIEYKSLNLGIMHACGHDVHTTCLLGAAKILNELKNDWEGTIKLIFQPGEEKNPGGASILIREGVLENPKPESIFGLHVHPGLEAGKLSFRGGMVMASADEIYITVKGKGGHAAAPHLTADTILAASQLVGQSSAIAE